MRIITRQELANRAANTWKGQYLEKDGWRTNLKGPTELVYNSIIQLGDNPNPDEVDKIIGNGSWTRVKCDECQQDQNAAIITGTDEASIYLCKSCISTMNEQLKNFAV